jgi:hypothetical protein
MRCGRARFGGHRWWRCPLGVRRSASPRDGAHSMLLLGLRRQNSESVGNRGDHLPGYALASQSVRYTGGGITGPHRAALTPPSFAEQERHKSLEQIPRRKIITWNCTSATEGFKSKGTEQPLLEPVSHFRSIQVQVQPSLEPTHPPEARASNK